MKNLHVESNNDGFLEEEGFDGGDRMTMMIEMEKADYGDQIGASKPFLGEV